MTIVTPPRPDELDERVANLEALIEEARQRARSSCRQRRPRADFVGEHAPTQATGNGAKRDFECRGRESNPHAPNGVCGVAPTWPPRSLHDQREEEPA